MATLPEADRRAAKTSWESLTEDHWSACLVEAVPHTLEGAEDSAVVNGGVVPAAHIQLD